MDIDSPEIKDTKVIWDIIRLHKIPSYRVQKAREFLMQKTNKELHEIVTELRNKITEDDMWFERHRSLF